MASPVDTDVRIGAMTEIKETHLDFDAQNGNQFAVIEIQEWFDQLLVLVGQHFHGWSNLAGDLSVEVLSFPLAKKSHLTEKRGFKIA